MHITSQVELDADMSTLPFIDWETFLSYDRARATHMAKIATRTYMYVHVHVSNQTTCIDCLRRFESDGLPLPVLAIFKVTAP